MQHFTPFGWHLGASVHIATDCTAASVWKTRFGTCTMRLAQRSLQPLYDAHSMETAFGCGNIFVTGLAAFHVYSIVLLTPTRPHLSPRDLVREL